MSPGHPLLMSCSFKTGGMDCERSLRKKAALSIVPT